MWNIIRNYVISFIVFFIIDILWLGLIAKNIYNKYLGYIIKDNFNWIAAIIFYIIFIIGIQFFVLNPAIEKQSVLYAFLVGGIFGFITYSTYDLTNLATIKQWPMSITIIDIIWGSILSSLTSGISYLIINFFNK
ncbi:DUF2177 family protein [Oceanotoga sp. DSM 15011]|jgi:uncharacterized membrane protein|uniref:Membrane protein n=1 Tax=Oceanotoga teriensis TaxID=515440 RepID=A0AA45C6E0_9BACT|nr:MULTISPECIES: DUF2177 family protein [Oceanotoga]PWJ91263.1 putative membrane protein [Oceanotoga teriensis]UYO99738.1 DUF2177 family protein [Oceanotoga sp. DSM 15011]